MPPIFVHPRSRHTSPTPDRNKQHWNQQCLPFQHLPHQRSCSGLDREAEGASGGNDTTLEGKWAAWTNITHQNADITPDHTGSTVRDHRSVKDSVYGYNINGNAACHHNLCRESTCGCDDVQGTLNSCSRTSIGVWDSQIKTTSELEAEPELVTKSNTSLAVEALAVKAQPAPTLMFEFIAELEVEPHPEAESVTSWDVVAWPPPATLPETIVKLDPEVEAEPKNQSNIKALPAPMFHYLNLWQDFG